MFYEPGIKKKKKRSAVFTFGRFMVTWTRYTEFLRKYIGFHTLDDIVWDRICHTGCHDDAQDKLLGIDLSRQPHTSFLLL